MFQIHYIPPVAPGQLPEGPLAREPRESGLPDRGPYEGERLATRPGRPARLGLQDLGTIGQARRNERDTLDLGEAWQALARGSRSASFQGLRDATTRLGPDGRPNMAALVAARRQLHQGWRARVGQGPLDAALDDAARRVDAALGRLIRRNAPPGRELEALAAWPRRAAGAPLRPVSAWRSLAALWQPSARPADARALHAEGLRLARAGRPDEALDALEAASERAPADAPIARDLGRLLLDQGYYGAAESALLQADALKPRDPAIQAALGETYAALGLSEAARAAFGRALAIEPGFTDAHNQLGVLHYESGDLTAAARHFQQAVSLDPRQVPGRYYLAQIALQQNDLLRARFQLDMVARLDPQLDLARFGVHTPVTLAGPRAGAPAAALHHWQLPRVRRVSTSRPGRLPG